MVSIESNTRYIITNRKAGTVIDLSGADNRTVIGYPRHGGENQQWEFIKVDDGWHIKNVSSGKYLRFEGNAEDGQPLIATPDSFIWHVWADEQDPSSVRICVPNTRQNVDLSDHGNPNPGTPVTLWYSWLPGENQTWLLEKGESIRMI